MIAIVEAFPLVWMIVTSVKDLHEVFNTVLPTEIEWRNFPRAWFADGFRFISRTLSMSRA